MLCNVCQGKGLDSRYFLFCNSCWHCVDHCNCTAGYTPAPEAQRIDGPSGDTVTLEVTLFPVRAGIDADKVAVQVLWCLEGRTVFPYQVHSVRACGSDSEFRPGSPGGPLYQEFPTRPRE